jgi:hypothetical protein
LVVAWCRRRAYVMWVKQCHKPPPNHHK